MINADAKMLALKALRQKLRKMMLEQEFGDGEMEGVDGDLAAAEKGENNMAEDAREMAETEAAVDGEDGEKKVSIEIEAEGEGADTGMEDLYKRMAAEFGSMPESRMAAGKKRGFMGGVGGGSVESMPEKMAKARKR